MKVGLAGVFISIIVTFIASGAIEAYSYRAGHADDPIDRLLSPLIEIYGVLTEIAYHWSGIGFHTRISNYNHGNEGLLVVGWKGF